MPPREPGALPHGFRFRLDGEVNPGTISGFLTLDRIFLRMGL